MTLAEIDLRVGGRWRYVMVADGGFEVAFHGEYREIVPNERIVSTEVYEGMPDAEALNTTTFTEDGRAHDAHDPRAAPEQGAPRRTVDPGWRTGCRTRWTCSRKWPARCSAVWRRRSPCIPSEMAYAGTAPSDAARAPATGWLGRAGLVARGVVYAVIGVLALKLALGDGGKATSQQGALKTVAREPFGKVLLVCVAIGLGGYAIWRLVRAAAGHGRGATTGLRPRRGALQRHGLRGAVRHRDQDPRRRRRRLGHAEEDDGRRAGLDRRPAAGRHRRRGPHRRRRSTRPTRALARKFLEDVKDATR